MSIVFSVTPFRDVHDIKVKSENGRDFVVDIYEGNAGNFDSTVMVLDNVSTVRPGSWLYNTSPNTTAANDNFKAGIVFVQNYLKAVDAGDSIIDIHNPCNCAFVSQADQDAIISSLGLTIKVRVN